MDELLYLVLSWKVNCRVEQKLWKGPFSGVNGASNCKKDTFEYGRLAWECKICSGGLFTINQVKRDLHPRCVVRLIVKPLSQGVRKKLFNGPILLIHRRDRDQSESCPRSPPDIGSLWPHHTQSSVVPNYGLLPPRPWLLQVPWLCSCGSSSYPPSFHPKTKPPIPKGTDPRMTLLSFLAMPLETLQFKWVEQLTFTAQL